MKVDYNNCLLYLFRLIKPSPAPLLNKNLFFLSNFRLISQKLRFVKQTMSFCHLCNSLVDIKPIYIYLLKGNINKGKHPYSEITSNTYLIRLAKVNTHTVLGAKVNTCTVLGKHLYSAFG